MNSTLFEAISNGHEFWTSEYRFRRADDTYAIVFDRGLISRDAAGRPVRMIGSVTDVAEQREAEEKIREFTAALERSNSELQDFASVASHDLQEPLRKIQTFAEELNQYAGEMGDEGRDLLERMQSAATRMRTLINDLLSFARVTTKAQPFARTDLSHMAQLALSNLETRMQETGATVEVGGLQQIDADPTQMQQLLQNLIGNGLKFQHLGQLPHVKVSGAVVNAPGANGNGHHSKPLYRLTVEDNGIGFDEKYLDRIFTIFQRLHGRSQYEGTGIGLAICRKIAQRHGGDITATSAPGKGATFIVTLPVTQKNQESL